MAAMRPGATGASGRADCPTCRPRRICPRCCWTARAGAPQKKEADPALGRSRGGFGTQIHVLSDRRGRPLGLRVTGGPRHDRT